MNQVSLELGLLQLGEPPYSAARISELWQLASSRETPCSAADLTCLDHMAGAIASDHTDVALDLAARLVSARGDCGCWLRAALLGALFAWLAVQLWRETTRPHAVRLFHYSMLYLALLFVAMAVDAAV